MSGHSKWSKVKHIKAVEDVKKAKVYAKHLRAITVATRQGGGDPWAMGVRGAITTTWATFAPCFLWIFVGAPYVEALRNNKSLNTAMTGITAGTKTAAVTTDMPLRTSGTTGTTTGTAARIAAIATGAEIAITKSSLTVPAGGGVNAIRRTARASPTTPVTEPSWLSQRLSRDS